MPDSDAPAGPIAEGTSFETKYPGALSEAAPFAKLYRLQQVEEHILTGEEGPLWLFHDKRVGLLLAFLAAKWQELPLMQYMTRDEIGYHLYRAASMAHLFLRSFHRQRMALHHLDLHLRRLRLPCARRPALRLPAEFQDKQY